MLAATPEATQANLKSISHRCHPMLVAFGWELTQETSDLPLGCLQGRPEGQKDTPKHLAEHGISVLHPPSVSHKLLLALSLSLARSRTLTRSV